MEAFDGQGRYITGVSITMTAFATSLVTTRMILVYKRRGWLGLEEAMVILANCFLVVITIIACLAVKYGFGLHSKAIAAAGGDRSKALEFFFLFQIFYKIVICFNKLAFLILYLRVFQFPSFRYICLASIALVLASSFSFVVATILQCLPIEYNWNRKISGHCIQNSTFRWSWAAVNTITDIWVSGLPVPFIQRLQMNRAKKAGLVLLFALGLFVCLASAIRMKAMVQSTHAKDTTWDSAPAFLWSYIEASVGLICTCLPSMRWLLVHIFPRLSSTHGRSESRRRAYKMGRLSSHMSHHAAPKLVPETGRSRIESTANQFGESESEEHIIDGGGIHVKTSVSVRSLETSRAGSD